MSTLIQDLVTSKHLPSFHLDQGIGSTCGQSGGRIWCLIEWLSFGHMIRICWRRTLAILVLIAQVFPTQTPPELASGVVQLRSGLSSLIRWARFCHSPLLKLHFTINNTHFQFLYAMSQSGGQQSKQEVSNRSPLILTYLLSNSRFSKPRYFRNKPTKSTSERQEILMHPVKIFLQKLKCQKNRSNFTLHA